MGIANGKAILIGEHAVVYGVPAIAVGIPRGARATARDARQTTLRVGQRRCAADDGSETGHAFAALLRSLSAWNVEVEVDVTLPLGVGLGGSAAIAVAAARAVLELSRTTPATEDTERALEAALQWERVFHGNPSGIDTAAAAHGGCVAFTRQGGPEPIRLAKPLHLAIGQAGPPASTRAMVERVARQREVNAETFDATLETIRDLSQRARRCLEAGHIAELGPLLDENHALLTTWQISTPELERACAEARARGALGAKLTGAGGGGCAIALAPDADGCERIVKGWHREGIEGFTAVVKPHPLSVG